MKLLLIYMLKNFYLEPMVKLSEMGFDIGFTLQPTSIMNLKLVKINDAASE